jgi:hypothetical protein
MTVSFDPPYSHGTAFKQPINLSIYEQLASSRYLHVMEREKTISPSRWPAWLNAAALLVATFVAIASLSLQVRPDSEVVAVAFPPWWSAQEVLLAAASANAAIVRMTALPALVVRPDDHDGLTRLRQAGAWLAMDPQAVAACFAKWNTCFSNFNRGTGNDHRKR